HRSRSLRVSVAWLDSVEVAGAQNERHRRALCPPVSVLRNPVSPKDALLWVQAIVLGLSRFRRRRAGSHRRTAMRRTLRAHSGSRQSPRETSRLVALGPTLADRPAAQKGIPMVRRG